MSTTPASTSRSGATPTLVDEPDRRQVGSRASAAGPAAIDGPPLWLSHGALPVALAAAFLTVAGIHRIGGPAGVVAAVALVALGSWSGARRLPAAVAGVVIWSAISAVLGLAVVAAAGAARADLSGVASGFAALAVGGAIVVLRWRPDDPDAGLSARASALVSATFAPARSWAAWIVGGGLGAPLVAVYAPIILDVDSAWVVMAAARGHEEGIRFLQQTQEVALPQVVLGPILRAWGYQGAMGFTIATVIALAAFTAAFAYHLTRRPLAAFVAAGSLLAMPSIASQASRLPMYATMLLLGYVGALLVHRAMGGRSSIWTAIVGGVALALAPEAHSLGQLFYVVPFLLLILHPDRRGVRALGASLAAIVVASIPRLWINLSIGGFRQLRSNRTDWLVERGYLRMINEQLHKQRSNDGPLAYLGNVPHLLTSAFGSILVVLLAVLVVAAALRAQRRTLLFGVAVAGSFLVALVAAAPATYGRYLTPLAVGAAAVAGVGAVAVVAQRREAAWHTGVSVVLVALVAVLSTSRIALDTRHHQNEVRRLSPRLHELADHVPPGAGVMGVRSNVMIYVNPNLHTVYGRTMSERDFVTYLTWPSDGAVIRMMRRIGVSWVVVRESKFAESKYHETWLRPVYGKRDAHQHRIYESNRFCRVANVNKTILYRIGHCPGVE